jgi:hypothetical protein
MVISNGAMNKDRRVVEKYTLLKKQVCNVLSAEWMRVSNSMIGLSIDEMSHAGEYVQRLMKECEDIAVL